MFSVISTNLFKGLRGVARMGGPSPAGPSRHIGQQSGLTPPYGTYTYRMNLEPYTADMVDIKVVDGEIVVRGKIEESVGEDTWSYQFVKRHRLPPEVDRESVESRFDKGQLVVTARLKER